MIASSIFSRFLALVPKGYVLSASSSVLTMLIFLKVDRFKSDQILHVVTLDYLNSVVVGKRLLIV